MKQRTPISRSVGFNRVTRSVALTLVMALAALVAACKVDEPVEYTLAVTVVGSGAVACDPDAAVYESASVVTLTATPATDWEFAGWEGDLGGKDNPAVLVMNDDMAVTGVFSPMPVLETDVRGEGVVTADPDQECYACGTVVTLAATPAEDWSFAGWEGDVTGASNPEQITMDGDRTVTAVFEYVDSLLPSIILIGDPVLYIPVGGGFVDPGAVASDDVDGDLTDQIVIVNPVNDAVPGVYTITYNVSDRAGNAATEVTREVNVVDVTPPTITLAGSSRLIVEMGTTYVDPGATANDDIDGDITALIQVNNPVDTAVPDRYIVTYNVSDAAGNPATVVQRLVDVVGFESILDAEGSTDAANDIVEDADGNFLVVGTANTGGVYPADIWVVKLDPDGNEVWSTTSGSFRTDAGNAVCTTADGNAIVAGASTNTTPPTSYPLEAFVTKIDADGQEVWSTQLPGTGSTQAYSVIECADESIAVAGSTNYGNQMWAAVLSSSGALVWEADYGGDGTEAANSLIECAAGGFLLAGTTTEGAGGTDALLVRIDTDGTELWSQTFGGTGDDTAASVIETSGGVFLVAGTTNSPGADGYDGWILTVSQTGTQLSAATFGGPNAQYLSDVVELSGGGFAASGWTNIQLGYDLLWLVGLDSDAAFEWDRSLGYWPDGEGRAIIEASDGSLVTAGIVRQGSGDYDGWVLKF